MLFNVMVPLVLIYRVEVWGGVIPLNAWNEIEKIQKMFSRRQVELNPPPPIRLYCWKQMFDL